MYQITNDFYGFIFTIVGIIIGAIISYFCTKLIIGKQFEKAEGHKFIEKYYLPLKSISYILIAWIRDLENRERKNEVKKINIKIYTSLLSDLQRKIENIFNRGVYILIHQINREVGNSLLELYFGFQYKKVDPNLFEYDDLDNKFVGKERIKELGHNLSKISIPKLIKEYVRAMNEEADEINVD